MIEEEGFIALIDVLGAKNFTTNKSKDFIRQRDEIIEKTKDYYSATIEKIINDKTIVYPEIATFGDTIIFTWNVTSEYKYKTVHLMAIWLNRIMTLGLACNLLFRGALSFGEYIFDSNSNTVLGPAIADAASWYEEADWLGIIATPSCGFLIDTSSGFNKSRNIDIFKWLVKYPVPLKSGKTLLLFALNWPYDLFIDEKEVTANSLLSHIFETNIPKGTESKYFNSMNFLEFIGNKVRKDCGMK
jgi:hypothetical protein